MRKNSDIWTTQKSCQWAINSFQSADIKFSTQIRFGFLILENMWQWLPLIYKNRRTLQWFLICGRPVSLYWDRISSLINCICVTEKILLQLQTPCKGCHLRDVSSFIELVEFLINVIYAKFSVTYRPCIPYWLTFTCSQMDRTKCRNHSKQ